MQKAHSYQPNADLLSRRYERIVGTHLMPLVERLLFISLAYFATIIA